MCWMLAQQKEFPIVKCVLIKQTLVEITALKMTNDNLVSFEIDLINS